MCTDLIVLLGPTAVGKTDLAIRLAELLSCDIINADSRQIYAGLSIGTAAPSPEQLARVRHHFVASLPSPETYYSAAQFEADVMHLLEQSSGPMLLTGGSMMYIDAVCNGIDNIPTISDEVRLNLKDRLAAEGIDVLADELRLLDPDYYAICDRRNPKRIVHALEVCYQSGTTYTSFRHGSRRERPFPILRIGLERPRAELYARINQRVDNMLADGLLDEVRSLLPFRHCNALHTVGYKELFAYLCGETTLNYAIEKIKQNTRIYSKKQMTWFKKDTTTHWFHPSQTTDILRCVSSFLNQ